MASAWVFGIVFLIAYFAALMAITKVRPRYTLRELFFATTVIAATAAAAAFLLRLW